jgi:hypothetical protein
MRLPAASRRFASILCAKWALFAPVSALQRNRGNRVMGEVPINYAKT